MTYGLPPDVVDLTGRRGAAAELAAALEPGAAMPVAALSGMGGVGKTTLAVHVAHAMSAKYPGGRLYVDLRGLDARPAEPYDVLGDLLRALGRTVVPGGLEERAALYRSELAARRMLVLLDGARDRAQVRPLLPGAAGSAVLVTSRVTMAGLPGVRLVELDVLEPYEAIALLTSVAGKVTVATERGAALDLVATCGFLPEAVREAGARLVSRPNLSVADLARLVARDPLGELPETAARLWRGHALLAREEARAFRLLAPSADAGLSTGAAAEALGLHPEHADDLVDALADRNLLECTAPGRYRCHPLMRRLAEREAEVVEPPRARAETLRGMLSFHLTKARAARRALDLETATPRAASTWLFTEHGVVLAAIERAAREPLGPLALAAELLLDMTNLPDDAWNPAVLEHAALAVRDAARERGLTGPQARAEYVLGHVRWWWRGDADGACTALRAAVHLGWRHGDPIPAALALDSLAAVTLSAGRIADAAALAAQAEQTWHEIGDLPYEAGTHVARGRLHLRRDAPASAVVCCALAVERYLNAGDAGGASHALHHLGTALRAGGRPEESLARHTESLVYGRACGSRIREPHTLTMMAETFLGLGRAGEAADHAEQALGLFGAACAHERGAALAVLGRALEAMGDHTGAHARLTQASELLEDGPALRSVRGRLGRSRPTD